MAKARGIISGASYDPDTLKILGQVFDEAWASIAGNFGAPSAVETARIKLANVVLSLAANGIRDAEQIKTSALAILAASPLDTK